MLKRLIAFSLNNSTLILICAGLTIVAAGMILPRMGVDMFPELNAPQVVIMTEAGGLAPDEVEQLVTFPIESEVNGLPGVRRVRSSSAISLSIVWVEFDWGTDIYIARNLVNERIAHIANELPPEVEPEIAPISSVAGEIMLVSLTSANDEHPADPIEMRSFAEFDLRNRIQAVPGIAQVTVTGGELPEYQILARQEQLLLHNLSLADLNRAAEAAHNTQSAGYLFNDQGREVPLRQMARVRNVDDIRNTLIRFENGAPLTIGDVAEVVFAASPKRGTGAENGRPAVVLSVQKSPGTNTLVLTDQVDQVLTKVEDAGLLPENCVLNRDAFRQAKLINISKDNLLRLLAHASIIIAVVLILFLLNVRTTIITLTALPLSLAATLIALWGLGLTINVMTLGGLAVAIGELVDDAIIDVENVYRRLRVNRELPEEQRLPRIQVIYHASNEIRGAIFFATIIIVLVFFPLLFLQGLEGRFFRPMGISYIISILASLLVALTVTPAMCKLLMRGRLGGGGRRDGFLVRALKGVYLPMLQLTLRFRLSVLGFAALATLGSLLLGATFGTSFLPKFSEGTFTVFLTSAPGTSLEEADRSARGVDMRIAEIEGVLHVVRRTGRAERDEHAEPAGNSETEVGIDIGYTRAQVRAELDKVLQEAPGVSTMIGQPIEHRLSHILSGTPAAIAINVFGEDLNLLRQVAKEIEGALKPVEGATDVNANRELMIRTMPIRYRHQDLARWGLSPADAAEQMSTAFYGHVAAVISEGLRRYDLVVRLDESERQDSEDVRNFMLRAETGQLVRLSEVADIGLAQSSNLIVRQNGRRKAVVSCNVAEGENLGHLIERVREVVDPIAIKHGLVIEYGGQFEAQQAASRMIALMGGLVAIVILLMLYSSFGSIRAALLVMVNLPLALIGGILAIYFTESPELIGNFIALFSDKLYHAPVISIASLVGFVTLFGIAIRNGLLLVNQYGRLILKEDKPLNEAIIQGSMERLIPIMMTSVSAMLGLIPLAMALGEPGSELLAPLAIVVLGGLTTSTLLNLVVVPAGYSLIFSRRPLRKPNQAETIIVDID